MKPTLHADALHGLPGEVVHAVEPYTEADPAAVLATFLTVFGCYVGSSPRVTAGGVHPARLHTLIVGRTAKARKGSSAVPVLRIFEKVDSEWSTKQIVGGFGSGEGVITTVADGDPKVLVREEEFGRVLAVAARQGSTIAQLLRGAWDSGKLENRTKSQATVVEKAHVSLLAHITVGELLDKLDRTDVSGGSVNRLLLVAAARSKRLSRGAALPDAEVARLARRTRDAVHGARALGEMRFTDRGGALWDVMYQHLGDDDPPGQLGEAIARAEPQVLRRCVAYAAADGTAEIDVPHIAAAYAVWQYARATAASIFPSRPLSDDETKLLRALATAGDAGMTADDQHALFSRHRTRQQLQEMRTKLDRLGLARTSQVPTGGRPQMLTIVTEKGVRSAKGEEDPAPSPLPKPSELVAQARRLQVIEPGGAA